MRSALVFGGAGQLGVATAERLLSSDWTVWVVTRGGRVPPATVMRRGATLLDGDGKSRRALISDVGRRFDAVFDATAYDQSDAEDLIGARGHFGGLVVVSSASVYADAQGRSLVETSQSGWTRPIGPLAEDAPTVDPGATGYSANKMALERSLQDSAIPVSILRPCAVHGVNSTHPREWWFIKRALDRREVIPVAYGGRSVFHTSSAGGVAALAVLCMEHPGQGTLNAADDEALTVTQIAAEIERATGLRLPLSPFDGAPLGASHVGSTPWSSEHPFILNTTRARGLGWRGGAYGDHVARVCRWILDTAGAGDWRKQFSRYATYGYDAFDYAAEDEALASL